jgi:hypothetical protein
MQVKCLYTLNFSNFDIQSKLELLATILTLQSYPLFLNQNFCHIHFL